MPPADSPSSPLNVHRPNKRTALCILNRYSLLCQPMSSLYLVTSCCVSRSAAPQCAELFLDRIVFSFPGKISAISNTGSGPKMSSGFTWPCSLMAFSRSSQLAHFGPDDRLLLLPLSSGSSSPSLSISGSIVFSCVGRRWFRFFACYSVGNKNVCLAQDTTSKWQGRVNTTQITQEGSTGGRTGAGTTNGLLTWLFLLPLAVGNGLSVCFWISSLNS